jgi:hypothetical protein
LSTNRSSAGSGASSTRAVFAGGFSGGYLNSIDYITIATTGNATNFGDLTYSATELSGVSSGTRAVFAGGEGSVNNPENSMCFITIASTGNAADFGDLIFGNQQAAGTSNCHGGL